MSRREEGSEEEWWEKWERRRKGEGYDCVHAGWFSCCRRGSEGTQSLFSSWRWAWGQKSQWFKSQLEERRKWRKMPHRFYTEVGREGLSMASPVFWSLQTLHRLDANSYRKGKYVLLRLQIQVPISFRNAFSDIPRKTFSTGHIVIHWSWHIICFLLLKKFFFI